MMNLYFYHDLLRKVRSIKHHYLHPAIFFLVLSVFILIPSLSLCVSPQFKIDEKWFDDLDGMEKRNLIRALVPYSKTFYFLDGAEQRGLTYELLKEFEKFVNGRLKRKTLKVRIVIIPTKRDQLLDALKEGRGDIAAGNLTITANRLNKVAFSEPLLTDVDEIIAAYKKTKPISTLDDLSNKEIYVRQSSSYFDSLLALNSRLKKAGKKPCKIKKVDPLLEDEDLLEMMDAGLLPMIVIDNHKALFWKQIFKNIEIYPNIIISSNGKIGWAVRKKSNQLLEVINHFINNHKKGTLMGNILFTRYLQNTDWVHNVLNEDEFQRFSEAVALFKKYGARYNFDWLLIAAVAYQESRINQKKRSPAGAVGVMQVLPSTARDKNINITEIYELEPNIHAGVKYLHFIRKQYFQDKPMTAMNKNLFSLAAYNAGPARVAAFRKNAQKTGLDPNVWFQNVEIIAAKKIGRETVQYVSNIYKYYIAYSRIMEKSRLKRKLKNQKL